jgi:6-phosphogluconolactonase
MEMRGFRVPHRKSIPFFALLIASLFTDEDSLMSRLLLHTLTFLFSVLCMSTAHARTIVYVSHADSREVYAMELNLADGTSTVIEKVATTGNAMPMAVSPDKRFLYVSLRTEPFSVNSFSIHQQSGKLTLIKTSPLPDNMAYIATDRTGKWLFTTSYAGTKSAIHAISTNGEVDTKPLKEWVTNNKSHAIQVDPSNKFLFTNNLGEDAIYQYRFDAGTGAMVPNTPGKVETPKGAGPRHFVFHPNRKFVFYVNELGGTVTTYAFNENLGTLAAQESVTLMPADFKDKPAAAEIKLTPDGTFLYATERSSNTLSAFAVDSQTGKLTFIARYAGEAAPRGFGIDPSGKYLLLVGTTTNAMTTFAIKPKDGTLTKVGRMDVGKNPNWVEIITLP